MRQRREGRSNSSLFSKTKGAHYWYLSVGSCLVSAATTSRSPLPAYCLHLYAIF
jgi:hypothetical protein